MRLFAKIPTCFAAAHRAAEGEETPTPDPKHSFAAKLVHLVQGQGAAAGDGEGARHQPDPPRRAHLQPFRLHRPPVCSTGADTHGAVNAAIAALEGPLHGGANEAVVHMLKEVGEPSKAAAWPQSFFDREALVMGFGHRACKHGDSRIPTITKYAEKMAEAVDRRCMEMSRVLAARTVQRKGVHPNHDVPTSLAYYLMGWDVPLFTPIFVASRVAGWAARVFEQWTDNRLIRPVPACSGLEQRAVPPMSRRRASNSIRSGHRSRRARPRRRRATCARGIRARRCGFC